MPIRFVDSTGREHTPLSSSDLTQAQLRRLIELRTTMIHLTAGLNPRAPDMSILQACKRATDGMLQILLPSLTPSELSRTDFIEKGELIMGWRREQPPIPTSPTA
jgi:hypothetical protein